MSTALPLISVIVPVYQVEPYIRQALDSIIHQTYRNLQILLIDDGSKDNSGKICDEYARIDRRVTVVHKQNGGVSSARNLGIDLALGEWIYFMDPDDWIEADLLERCISKADQAKVDMVAFDFESFDATVRYVPRSMMPKENELIIKNLCALRDLSLFTDRTTVWSYIVRSSAIKGRISFDTRLIMSEDRHFKWLLYRNIGSVLVIPDRLYHYRSTPSSITHETDVLKLYEARLLTHKRIQEVIASGGYPEDAERLENGKFVDAAVGFVANNLLYNDRMRFSEKKELLCRILTSDECRDSLANCDPQLLSPGGKIYFYCPKHPVFVAYLIYALKKIQSLLRNLRCKWSVLTCKDTPSQT